jgi:hypothetical protein
VSTEHDEERAADDTVERLRPWRPSHSQNVQVSDGGAFAAAPACAVEDMDLMLEWLSDDTNLDAWLKEL